MIPLVDKILVGCIALGRVKQGELHRLDFPDGLDQIDHFLTVDFRAVDDLTLMIDDRTIGADHGTRVDEIGIALRPCDCPAGCHDNFRFWRQLSEDFYCFPDNDLSSCSSV